MRPRQRPRRAAHASERDVRTDHAPGVVVEGLESVGQDRARRDCVDADVAVGVVEGGRPCQAEHGVLAGDVAGHASDSLQAGGRGHVDDRSASGLDHRGDLVFHREEDAKAVDGQRLLQVLDVELREGCRHVGQAGVVEGAVEAAVGGSRPLDQRLNGGRLGDVGRGRQRLAARGHDLRREGVQLLFATRRDHDTGAGVCERARGSGADAAARARDDRDLAFEQTGETCQRCHRAHSLRRSSGTNSTVTVIFMPP